MKKCTDCPMKCTTLDCDNGALRIGQHVYCGVNGRTLRLNVKLFGGKS